jgi:hypothetical protein
MHGLTNRKLKAAAKIEDLRSEESTSHAKGKVGMEPMNKN